jgi:hypothetical protein
MVEIAIFWFQIHITNAYMPTLERLKSVRERGSEEKILKRTQKWCILLHFGYKICVVKTLNII